MLIRLLGGGGVPARAVGGAVGELQRYVGCGEPVLETKHMRCKCAKEEWTSCSSCTEAKQGSTGKKRCEMEHVWVEWHLAGSALQVLQQQQTVTRRRQRDACAERGKPCRAPACNPTQPRTPAPPASSSLLLLQSLFPSAQAPLPLPAPSS